jgi:hypothetical protein
LKVGQGAIWALSDLTMEQKSRVAERWNATPWHSGQTGHEGGSTPAYGRRRLPGDALIKRDAGLGLAEEVPVGHRLGSILPGGRSAGRADPRRLGGLADVV